MKQIVCITMLICLLVSCKTQQVASIATPAVPAAPVPIWVSSRPNNGFKYIGIGFAEKSKGGNYQMEAKKNALYDLASEIKVNISSNSVLYTAQNNNSFNESFNSLITLSNTDNIEGYTQVDAYENDKQYWVYYQLDKEEYANRKAEKKRQTISRASALITASFYDEKNQDFSACLKKRIQAFGLLTPYLSEEIVFDPATTGGLKSVFDLTSLVQQQLQSITLVQSKKVPVLKPYQPVYSPLNYSLQIKGKTPLQNFPLIVRSDNDLVEVERNASTNEKGELQVTVRSVEPVTEMLNFSLHPDVTRLMGRDSVGKAGVRLLRQFIQTSALKVPAQVSYITIFVSAEEKNFGKSTGFQNVENFIVQKFQGQEVRLVQKPEEADYIIEAIADTQEDISSAILDRNYGLKMASLVINLQLKNRLTNEVLYKGQVNELYGYANQLDKAGLNAYACPKFIPRLAESVFFLKRKILVY